ncbi:NADAR family protein [Acanthopleuribacter pedis]|uniref:NADAR family protein n=1 Tax=Acanthopleuribacter pedis TaxID=442870 RepID=A0A8J7U2J8_9BACT|nr:NADAR family protein [Acanthopleuribacter pedis]MBO1317323.1 NADAR family protein [Acanthopleuribacter pedis]MBO1318630.1 NADAR family protein [Acanthopleuribacter pedis]
MQPPILDWDSLKQQIQQGASPRYLFFWSGSKGKKGTVSKNCFSQWWREPFEAEGVTYASAEHFMMAEKARLFGDSDIQAQVIEGSDPRKAKALGRKVKNFDPAIWEKHRFDIVVRGNLAKFRARPELTDFILGTGDQILVEASPQDRIWGIGLAEDHPAAADPFQWQGLNLLGFALHAVRHQLQSQASQSR